VLLSDVTRIQPVYQLRDLYNNQHQVLIVTDASLQKDYWSRFTWIIAHKEHPLWKRVGLAPGPAEDMHLGQAEAFGMLEALTFLQHYILSYYPATFAAASISCYCDNNGIIATISKMTTSQIVCPNETTNDNHDVFLATNDVISNAPPISLCFIHVKGHQDTKSNQPLTIPEQLNVECNHKAKNYITSTTTFSTLFGNPAIPAAQLHVRIGSKLICCKLIRSLHQVLLTKEYFTTSRKNMDGPKVT